MYAYKEIIIIDDPQQIYLSHPLPFLKGKRVEILIIAEDDLDETDYILQNKLLMQQITLSEQTHQQQTGEDLEDAKIIQERANGPFIEVFFGDLINYY